MAQDCIEHTKVEIPVQQLRVAGRHADGVGKPFVTDLNQGVDGLTCGRHVPEVECVGIMQEQQWDAWYTQALQTFSERLAHAGAGEVSACSVDLRNDREVIGNSPSQLDCLADSALAGPVAIVV